MSVLTVKPEFLYPISRQFPFDEVADKIVRALEKRNWCVPKVVVRFDIYGSGEAKYQIVREIIGEDFRLHFCRIQRTLPGNIWNDTAGLDEICIPKQQIDVFDDESGPTYYLYVGQDWEADKKWFMNSSKVNSKLRGEPRRYLRYSGYGRGRRASDLIADNDLSREYSPEGDEPRSFKLKEKFDEFTTYLEEHVLNYILQFPEEPVKEFETLKLIPYTGPWHTLYSICNWYEAERIIQGINDPKRLPAHERHATFGVGRRLVPLGVRNNGRFPKAANNGFVWCDISSKISSAVSNEMKSFMFKDNNIVSIKLKYANDVYVADQAAYDVAREKTFEKIAPRDLMTDKEYDDVLVARGATIIPITEYKGNYKQPIVLIARELDFDEIDAICFEE